MNFWQKLFGRPGKSQPSSRITPAFVPPATPRTVPPVVPPRVAPPIKATTGPTQSSAISKNSGTTAKVITGVVVVTRRSLSNQQALFQAIRGEQQGAGNAFSPNARISFAVGNPDDELAIVSIIRSQGYSAEDVETTRISSFRGTDGNDGKYCTIFGKSSGSPKQAMPVAPKQDKIREYATAYVFYQKQSAENFFSTLKNAIQSGTSFPFSEPHQIALVDGPAACFVATLVQLQHENDESVAVGETIRSWFKQCNADGFYDRETLTAPMPGRAKGSVRASLGREYSILDTIGTIK